MGKILLSKAPEDGNARRDALIEALSTESDRGLVLTAASYIDEALGRLLRVRFSMEHKKSKSVLDPLFVGFGPLSSFSAKIRMSYAIDLIEKWVYRDLETLRKLRNAFAHSIAPAVFDSAEVVRLTETLAGADHAVTAFGKRTPAPENLPRKKVAQKRSKADDKASMERFRIIMTVSFIAGYLDSKTKHIVTDGSLAAELPSSYDLHCKDT